MGFAGVPLVNVFNKDARDDDYSKPLRILIRILTDLGQSLRLI